MTKRNDETGRAQDLRQRRLWLSLGLCSTLFLCCLLPCQERSHTSTRRFDPTTAGDRDSRPLVTTRTLEEVPSFEAIQRSESGGNYHLRQVRRVMDGQNWLSMREELWITPTDSKGKPRFKLILDGVEARELSPTELSRRREEFSSRSAFLFQHTACRIVDAELAELNYVIMDLGAGMRIDRPVRKVLLLPKRLGSTPWILELDQKTNYPLYREEFDRRGQVIASLEVTEFEHGLAARAPEDLVWWQESRSVQRHADLESAVRDFAATGITIPDTTSLPVGYVIVDARIVRSDLNDEVTLVQTYSDGIDEIFLLVTTNTTQPVLLDSGSEDMREVSLMTFSDLNTSQLMFYHGDLRYQVIGKAAGDRLNSLARSLIRQAFR